MFAWKYPAHYNSNLCDSSWPWTNFCLRDVWLEAKSYALEVLVYIPYIFTVKSREPLCLHSFLNIPNHGAK